MQGLSFKRCGCTQEFMEGGSLKALIQQQMSNAQRRCYSYADALRWLTQV